MLYSEIKPQSKASQQLLDLEEHYTDLRDELTFLCETMAIVLKNDVEMSQQYSNGLANVAYALESRVQNFGEELFEAGKGLRQMMAPQ